ncbi:MAG: response regulator, partial [Geobacter sp.]|nr:response regulator [Geobacter sp.]
MAKYAELFRPEGSPAGNEAPSAGSAERTDQQFTVLFVDDEEGVLSAMKRIFLEESYTILTATSADKALAVMERERVHLLVSDHRMPGMTGAELLKEVKNRWPETIRIMLTGHADVNSIMGAVKEGAVYKFITKPW